MPELKDEIVELIGEIEPQLYQNVQNINKWVVISKKLIIKPI